MAKGKQGHLVPYAGRAERGTAIPVVAHKVTLPDGKTVTGGYIDLSAAEVPERSYFAEACGAKYENHTLTMVLAQPKLGGGLRSMVLISMTPLSAAQFLVSVDEMKSPSLDEIAKTVNIDPEPLLPFPESEPEQTAPFAASVIAVAVAGRETCMDIYHSNAFSQVKVKASNEINLEPMVRVSLRTGLFLSLVNHLRGFKSQFPPDAKLWEEART